MRRSPPGLRPIAARHPDDIGTTGDRRLGDRQQIVTRLQDDRLDPPRPALADQVEPFDPATARSRVHDQHRPPGGRHRRSLRRTLARGSGRAAQGDPSGAHRNSSEDQRPDHAS
jgi:hypothetical protein